MGSQVPSTNAGRAIPGGMARALPPGTTRRQRLAEATILPGRRRLGHSLDDVFSDRIFETVRFLEPDRARIRLRIEHRILGIACQRSHVRRKRPRVVRQTEKRAALQYAAHLRRRDRKVRLPGFLGHQTYNIVVIDGRYRFDCATRVADWVTADGVVILDNSDWLPSTAAMLATDGFFQVDFIGPGPLNAYAWATSLFFRPNCFLQKIRTSSAPVVIGGMKYTSDEDVSLVSAPKALKGPE